MKVSDDDGMNSLNNLAPDGQLAGTLKFDIRFAFLEDFLYRTPSKPTGRLSGIGSLSNAIFDPLVCSLT